MISVAIEIVTNGDAAFSRQAGHGKNRRERSIALGVRREHRASGHPRATGTCLDQRQLIAAAVGIGTNRLTQPGRVAEVPEKLDGFGIKGGGVGSGWYGPFARGPCTRGERLDQRERVLDHQTAGVSHHVVRPHGDTGAIRRATHAIEVARPRARRKRGFEWSPRAPRKDLDQRRPFDRGVIGLVGTHGHARVRGRARNAMQLRVRICRGVRRQRGDDRGPRAVRQGVDESLLVAVAVEIRADRHTRSRRRTGHGTETGSSRGVGIGGQCPLAGRPGAGRIGLDKALLDPVRVLVGSHRHTRSEVRAGALTDNDGWVRSGIGR